ncbi:MAG: hypothetical protein QOJ42_268 [Acidobacteriaceae bacterium]|jgi:hypothetical protein|nr:hypothetical protein [Acidobacteriaceae bacterium]
MSTKSREVLWGGRILGAKIRAQGARERAAKAVRAAPGDFASGARKPPMEATARKRGPGWQPQSLFRSPSEPRQRHCGAIVRRYAAVTLDHRQRRGTRLKTAAHLDLPTSR